MPRYPSPKHVILEENLKNLKNLERFCRFPAGMTTMMCLPIRLVTPKTRKERPCRYRNYLSSPCHIPLTSPAPPASSHCPALCAPK